MACGPGGLLPHLDHGGIPVRLPHVMLDITVALRPRLHAQGLGIAHRVAVGGHVALAPDAPAHRRDLGGRVLAVAGRG